MGNPTAGKWQQLEVDGKTCDVFAPTDPGPYALLYLHDMGLESLADNPVWTRLLEERRLLTLCPHGGHSWWANRTCPEFDPKLTPERYLIDSVLAFVRESWGIRPPKIGVTGIGMGGQGALRLAMKYPSILSVATAISAAIDYHNWYGRGTPIDVMYIDKEAARQDTMLLHIQPLNWPRHILFLIDPADTEWLDGNMRLHEKLAALGIPHEYDLQTSAGGHSWEYFDHVAPRVIDFICRGLDAEGRRIPVWRE